MANANSIGSCGRTKPAKPYPSFPLYAHNTNRWAEKLKEKVYYFGSWADPQGALREYEDWRDAQRAGYSPGDRGGLTIKQLFDVCLASHEADLRSGEIAQRTCDSLLKTGKFVADFFGRQRSVASLTPKTTSQRSRPILPNGRTRSASPTRSTGRSSCSTGVSRTTLSTHQSSEPNSIGRNGRRFGGTDATPHDASSWPRKSAS